MDLYELVFINDELVLISGPIATCQFTSSFECSISVHLLLPSPSPPLPSSQKKMQALEMLELITCVRKTCLLSGTIRGIQAPLLKHRLRSCEETIRCSNEELTLCSPCWSIFSLYAPLGTFQFTTSSLGSYIACFALADHAWSRPRFI
jgi:hypothetical protein